MDEIRRILRLLCWRWCIPLSIFSMLSGVKNSAAIEESFRLRETTLPIPQVDYEDAVYYAPGDPLPHIDMKKVRWDQVVDKNHRAVVMETDYLQLTILPEMGRVYSLVYRPTGHETLWRNDIVRPGGANNETGWWLWIGGVEYTLPGDEHGTTWALPWTYEILEDSPSRKAMRMEVEEPTTGLHERIDLSVYPQSASFEADIRIWNPTADTVHFAHWVNPQWVPGGVNELTDNTEFIIPTRQILIEERWQANLGPSPQSWPGNPLRFIRSWEKMGDIMADGLEAGFFSAYSHDADEGIVRIFDPLSNPGVDMWTYGFHPSDIPMGSGAPNKGYAEIWGGTVELFPDETRPLPPGASIAWTEWMYPYQQTGGLTFANEFAALTCLLDENGQKLDITICPSRPFNDALLRLQIDGRTQTRRPFRAAPDAPFRTSVTLEQPALPEEILLIVEEAGAELVRCRAIGTARF